MDMGIHSKRQGSRQIFPLSIIEQRKRRPEQSRLTFLLDIILFRRHIKSGTHGFSLKTISLWFFL